MNRLSSPTTAWRIISDAALIVAAAFAATLLVLGYAQTVDAAELPTGHSDYSDIEENSVYHRRGIDYLIDQGVLTYDTGCDDADSKKFCPSEEMPRWQVAVWIARAVNVVEENDPDPTDLPSQASFSDVDIDDSDIWWAYHVEFIYERGITSGCRDDGNGDREFCPDNIASRAQMASMLRTAFDVDDATEIDVFADVAPGSSHADAIDAIAGVHITVGCSRKAQVLESGTAEEDYDENERYYCPYSSPKQQMATLLARAMSWSLEEYDDFEPIETTAKDTPPAGGKQDGERMPDAGGATTADDFLIGSLFIGLLTASIICGRIYLDSRKRQNSHAELA